MHFKGISLKMVGVQGGVSMNTTNQKSNEIVNLLEKDVEYQALEQQRQDKLDHFRAVLGTLTQEQRDAIIDYIGICEEQHWRAVEVAVSRW